MIMKTEINTVKVAISFKDATTQASKILNETQSRANLIILKILTALNPVNIILFSYLIVKLIIMSVTEIQTIIASSKLNLSAAYSLTPSASTLIIISIKKHKVRKSFTYESVFVSDSLFGYRSRLSITKFNIIRSVIARGISQFELIIQQ